MGSARLGGLHGLIVAATVVLTARCGGHTAIGPNDAGIGVSSGTGTGGTCGGTCADACARIVGANCLSDHPADTDRTACEDECSRTQAMAPTACACDFGRFLACVANATVQCPARICQGLACMESPLTALGCEDLSSRVKECGGSCIGSDVSIGGGGENLSFNYATSGCMCPATLERSVRDSSAIWEAEERLAEGLACNAGPGRR
jgi:hypothetical protein